MLHYQSMDVIIDDPDKALQSYLFAILDGKTVRPVTGIHNFRQANVILEDVHFNSGRASVVISGVYHLATSGKVEAGDLLYATPYGKAKTAENFMNPMARALQSNKESGNIIKVRLI